MPLLQIQKKKGSLTAAQYANTKKNILPELELLEFARILLGAKEPCVQVRVMGRRRGCYCFYLFLFVIA